MVLGDIAQRGRALMLAARYRQTWPIVAGIAGNYDSTVATDYQHCGCRSESPRQEELAHLSYEWTRAHVSKETKRYLAALPFRMDVRPRGGHVPGPRSLPPEDAAQRTKIQPMSIEKAALPT